MSVKYRFVRGVSLSSSIIAWAGGGDNSNLGWSHVDICMPDGSLIGARSDAVGGKPPGVWKRPYAYEPVLRSATMELQSTSAQEAIFYQFLEAQIGKPYDKTAIWAFILDREWRDSDSWYCSELAAAATEAAGICDKLYLPVNKISPTTWSVVVSALGGVTQ